MGKYFNTCCFCGELFEGMGNSTWGCWSPVEEKQFTGEKMRCCDKCNASIVVPTRLERYEEKKKEYENQKF